MATVVSRSFAEKHKITKVRLPASLAGHALALRFVPLDSFAPAFLVVNCYLSSDGYVARGKHIGALMGIPVSLYSFFLGDWNFVLSEEDTTSRYVPPPRALPVEVARLH